MSSDAAAKPRPRLKAKPRPRLDRKPGLPIAETDKLRDALPRAGWRVVAAKELGDHLLSVRFIVLLLVLGLTAVIPLYFAAGEIRAAAPDASGVPAVFLFLFTLGAEEIQNQSVFTFIAIVAPLLGMAFAFDAVNG